MQHQFYKWLTERTGVPEEVQAARKELEAAKKKLLTGSRVLTAEDVEAAKQDFANALKVRC